jgi:hypothetical protein
MNKNNILYPSWLGKINWSHGLPLSPEKYNSSRIKLLDSWGEYKSPIWDDMYEYRKTFSNRNYYSFDNFEKNNNLQDKDNQFITISKNKKKNNHCDAHYTSRHSNRKPYKHSSNNESNLNLDIEILDFAATTNIDTYINNVKDVKDVKDDYDYEEYNF